jgi:membrane-associated phospholipid phosphatase
MPSCHAQIIGFILYYYYKGVMISSLYMEYIILIVLSFIILIYRIYKKYHTLNQIIIGLIIGFIYDI